MGFEIQKFFGDATQLLGEIAKINQAHRLEAATRAKNAADARKLAAEERDQLRKTIQSGRERKRLTEEIGRAALKASTESIKSTADYNRVLFAQEQALKRGAISLDQFKRRKFALLNALRELRREQSGENTLLREAERVIKTAASATDIYRRGVVALNLAKKRGKIDNEQYALGLRKLRTDLEAVNRGQNSWRMSMLQTAGAITGMTGGVAIVLRVVSQLRAEYERLLEQQREARDAHLPLAAIQSQAVKNLGVDKEFDAKKLFQFIRQKSQEIGIDEVELTAAASDALSARGSGTARSALNSVLAAAKFERFGGRETLATLAGSASDIRKKTGLSDEASLGFLSQIGQLSRVTRTEELSRNIAPAVVNALSSGASREFAGSMVAALSQGIVDTTGRVSRTGLTSVVTALERFEPGQNIERTFEKLLTNQDARAQFFQTNSFEKKAQFAVRDLFTQGSEINNTFRAGLQTLRGNGPQAQFNRVVSQTEGLESFRVARFNQYLTNTTNQAQLANVDGAISAAVRDSLDGIRKALGKSGFGSKISQLVEDAQNSGVLDKPALQKALKDEIFSFRKFYEYQGPERGVVARDRVMTLTEEKQVLILEKLARGVEAMNTMADPIAPIIPDVAVAGGQPINRPKPRVFDPAFGPKAPKPPKRELTVAEMSRTQADRFLMAGLSQFQNLPGDDAKVRKDARAFFNRQMEAGASPEEAVEAALDRAAGHGGGRLNARDSGVLNRLRGQVRRRPGLQNNAAAEQNGGVAVPRVNAGDVPNDQQINGNANVAAVVQIGGDPLQVLIKKADERNGLLTQILGRIDGGNAGGGRGADPVQANDRRAVEGAKQADRAAAARHNGRRGGLR